jgi:hypothetical protein
MSAGDGFCPHHEGEKIAAQPPPPPANRHLLWLALHKGLAGVLGSVEGRLQTKIKCRPRSSRSAFPMARINAAWRIRLSDPFP